MDHAGSDHPVFKRFSRQQLIVRRRNIGFQSLVFESLAPAPRCKHCARSFNSVWKVYLCHVCGLLVCQPCSNVVERERTLGRIQFVRACFPCMGMLNKWSDPGLLTEYAMEPWVVESSKNQLGLNLADALRSRKGKRRAVLILLRHLDMHVENAIEFLDQIGDEEWSRALAHDGALTTGAMGPEISETFKHDIAELAQSLIQQCFEVPISELPIQSCQFAESHGSRSYPLYFDADLETPHAPQLESEASRVKDIARYDLLGRDLNDEEMQLICELAAREMECVAAYVAVVEGNFRHVVAHMEGGLSGLIDRGQSFSSYALASTLPFLVRDATLDIRFRNFVSVRGVESIRFFSSFPVYSDRGSVIASLCVIDNKPRKHVTTMQYSIMKMLAHMISLIWNDELQPSA